jgi:hypothetical protein
MIADEVFLKQFEERKLRAHLKVAYLYLVFRFNVAVDVGGVEDHFCDSGPGAAAS